MRRLIVTLGMFLILFYVDAKPTLDEKGTTMTDKSRSDINTLNKRMYNVQEKYSQYGLMVPEERRNLCEGESNLAECIKEVEDAKSTPATSILQTENEGADEKKGEEDAEDHHEIMRRQEELIRKMVTEDDKNRDYWDEEYKSMNKWARYGIA